MTDTRDNESLSALEAEVEAARARLSDSLQNLTRPSISAAVKHDIRSYAETVKDQVVEKIRHDAGRAGEQCSGGVAPAGSQRDRFAARKSRRQSARAHPDRCRDRLAALSSPAHRHFAGRGRSGQPVAELVAAGSAAFRRISQSLSARSSRRLCAGRRRRLWLSGRGTGPRPDIARARGADERNRRARRRNSAPPSGRPGKCSLG